jgi:hypothetical protein
MAFSLRLVKDRIHGESRDGESRLSPRADEGQPLASGANLSALPPIQ